MTKLDLPALPWAPDALEPAISRATIDLHYGKHHKGYVDKTNAKVAGGPLEGSSLDEIVLEAARSKDSGLYNVAAQAWNHARYWESLSPDASAPSNALAQRIEQDFGGMTMLRDALVKTGVAHFASGWVWLTAHKGKLQIIDTHDADNALVHGHEALLVLDLWEHAYYLDYQNERERHLRTLVKEALNWTGASERFERAVG